MSASLLLHPSPAPMPSRKKACSQCTAAKTRCDLRKPACTRCSTRGRRCQYAGSRSLPMAQGSSPPDSASDSASADGSLRLRTAFASPAPSNASFTTPPHDVDNIATPLSLCSPTYVPKQAHTHVQPLDFENISLVSSVDFVRIRDRWLDAFISSPSHQTTKDFSSRTIRHISRILKSYPKMLLRANAGSPPFIHPEQLAGGPPVPLANCLSVVRMWWGRAPGSEIFVKDTVEREMARLLREYQAYNQRDLLAAFQAYLLYSMMACLSPSSLDNGHGGSENSLESLFDGTNMAALQEIASQISQTGIVCSEELTHTRPRWECWLVAEAKRRTLFSMYLLENVFNWTNGTVSYLAEELAMLPAPCGKRMWEAQSREAWAREYDLYLQNWESRGLKMHEFWPKSDGEQEREMRVDKWAEDVDEFGMLLLGACTETHGS